MLHRKTVVILANSVKHGQHCVAGKCLNSNEWIRPVADPAGSALNDEQIKYENPYGRFSVKPLQKIEMGLERHSPLINQPENYVINNSRWRQKFKIEYSHLDHFLDEPESLWGDEGRVQLEKIQTGAIVITQSLYLIAVENLLLYKVNSHKRRAKFIYKNCIYDLPATDPNFDELVTAEISEKQSVICVSLGEEFNGYCYKLVATIF